MQSGITIATARDGIVPRWGAVIPFRASEVHEEELSRAERCESFELQSVNMVDGIFGRTPLTFDRNGMETRCG